MMISNTLRATAFLVVLIATASCRKDTTSRSSTTSSYTSTVYGYTTDSNAFQETSCKWGTVNTSTAGFTSLGVLMTSTLFSNLGAYSTSDGCYYAFSQPFWSGPRTLNKISASGTATTYTATSVLPGRGALAFIPASNTLICTDRDNILKISISGTTFSTSTLATPLHPFHHPFIGPELAVNNNTGDVYYVTEDTSNYYLERYRPGATAPEVVISGGGLFAIFGLCYNAADNKLYAITVHGVTGGAMLNTYSLTKIDPSTGSITVLDTLGYSFNTDYFSACIDPGSNRYICSTIAYDSLGVMSIPLLCQYNTSGALVQMDTLPQPYSGLNVHSLVSVWY